jgi:hypothetical protein
MQMRIELGPRSSRPRHALISEEVIASDADGQKIRLLPLADRAVRAS